MATSSVIATCQDSCSAFLDSCHSASDTPTWKKDGILFRDDAGTQELLNEMLLLRGEYRKRARLAARLDALQQRMLSQNKMQPSCVPQQDSEQNPTEGVGIGESIRRSVRSTRLPKRLAGDEDDAPVLQPPAKRGKAAAEQHERKDVEDDKATSASALVHSRGKHDMAKEPSLQPPPLPVTQTSTGKRKMTLMPVKPSVAVPREAEEDEHAEDIADSPEGPEGVFACPWPGCDKVFPGIKSRCAHLRWHGGDFGHASRRARRILRTEKAAAADAEKESKISKRDRASKERKSQMEFTDSGVGSPEGKDTIPRKDHERVKRRPTKEKQASVYVHTHSRRAKVNADQRDEPTLPVDGTRSVRAHHSRPATLAADPDDSTTGNAHGSDHNISVGDTVFAPTRTNPITFVQTVVQEVRIYHASPEVLVRVDDEMRWCATTGILLDLEPSIEQLRIGMRLCCQHTDGEQLWPGTIRSIEAQRARIAFDSKSMLWRKVQHMRLFAK